MTELKPGKTMSDEDHPPTVTQRPAGRATANVSSLISKLFQKLESLGKFNPPPSPAGPEEKRTSDEMALERTVLAVDRTLMAADRTLMAWVRTALSMVSFGFTIYKILQGLAESGTALGAATQPRVVALFLIGLGNLSILLGIMEYWQTARGLSRTSDIPIWRPSFLMAVLIGVLSVFLFVAVIFKAL